MQIIPPSLAIKAMRDNGYRDAAHALAELIDNSIQSGAKNVELICLDKVTELQQRSRNRVDRIAVCDDGCGMDATVLEMALQFGNGTRLNDADQTGIGKFGMGLPNSSISQCQKVEVWSWQKGEVLYSYLDIEEIMEGKLQDVPSPVPGVLPEEVVSQMSRSIGVSGTIVLWSRLDRVRWKNSKTLLQNSELLVGRMYRHFIVDGSVRIRLAAYSKGATGGWTNEYDSFSKPNDPLYLMSDTSCPVVDGFEGDSLFEEFGKSVLDVELPGDTRKHQIVIKFSLVKHQLRKALNATNAAGKSPPGQHAGKNIGISLVRAGRELELSQSHVIGYDPVERWWGIEVSFEPALDAIFGVTNNKQAATGFGVLNKDQDAQDLGFTTEEYEAELVATQDLRRMMYEVSRTIHRNLKAMRGQLGRMTEGQKVRPIATTPTVDPAEEAATKATRQRIDEGHAGGSDLAESKPAEERTEQLTEGLTQSGADPEEAKELAIAHIGSNLKYIFQQQAYHGPSFFAVSSRGGSIIVTVNKDHPVSTYLIGLLESSENASSDEALMALKLMLCSWARMEDETQNPTLRQRYVDFRDSWGRLTKDFFDAAYEE